MDGWMRGRETSTDGERRTGERVLKRPNIKGVRASGASKVPSPVVDVDWIELDWIAIAIAIARVSCRPRLYFYSVIEPTGSVTEENG